jgi:hypothetical protein
MGEIGLLPFPLTIGLAAFLLHVTSLPSLGDLGPSAWVWIDRLHDAGQSWRQTLPKRLRQPTNLRLPLLGTGC